jgi:hypothetical protein
MIGYETIAPNAALQGLLDARIPRVLHAYAERAATLHQWPVPISHAVVSYQKNGLILITLENPEFGWVAVFSWDFVTDKPALYDWMAIWDEPAYLYTDVPPPVSVMIIRESL